jgi:hypothetical protein
VPITPRSAKAHEEGRSSPIARRTVIGSGALCRAVIAGWATSGCRIDRLRSMNFSLLEEDWATYANDIARRLQTCLTGLCLTARFSDALRGEELPRLDLGAMRKNWHEALSHPSSPHSLEDSRKSRTRKSFTSQWSSRQPRDSTIGNGLTGPSWHTSVEACSVEVAPRHTGRRQGGGRLQRKTIVTTGFNFSVAEPGNPREGGRGEPALAKS